MHISLQLIVLKQHPSRFFVSFDVQSKKSSKVTKKDGKKTFKNVIKDFKKSDGLFTIYWSKEKNKAYLSILPDQLEKVYLAGLTRQSGDGYYLDGSSMLNEYPFMFRQIGNRVQFVNINVKFRADKDSPFSRSVDRHTSHSILSSTIIESDPHPKDSSILVDIGKLFIAGVLPGILTVFLYITVIRIVTAIKKEWGPPGDHTNWPDRFRALGKVWCILLLFLFILGGIYAGIFTPSEAGGIGATGALFFAIARKKMTWKEFYNSLVDAGKTTVFVFTVAYGAIIFSNFINIAGMPDDILKFVNDLDVPPMGVIFAILAIYVVLGAVFEGIGMILLTVPIFFPVVQSLGFDLIWFGIVVIMVTEISLITPQVGMNVFVLKTMLPDVSLWTIFKCIGPFFCADLLRLGLVVIFPQIL